ncbi:alpha/beta fold hydrolase [Labedaea rhizosphaerae]|uniref:Thioesterase domain-containing protein n=1 Tax=Labedaea rhizosphaerae TaxID=598644 RepID=A0A4R6S047_LABRH|nr:alpha/beta fold hydrolase [Labedaea rhizosphaerae]TDP92852.1 thioesterase domain-containing protein [Labedaea rhizosphaerae]
MTTQPTTAPSTTQPTSEVTLPGRLITLVRRRDRPVCVMLPGAGGGLGPYLQLASSLGTTHSVYAVRAAGLLPGERPETSVAEMADAALAAVGDLIPSTIFGWSLGGTVGWELAVRLADRGITPDLVVVDASPLPRPATAAGDEHVRSVILAGLGPRPEPQTVERVLTTVGAQLRALVDYRIERTYPGRVLLLMCADSPGANEGFTEREQAVRRWRELAPDLRVEWLSAEHFAVFDPAHLGELIDRIAQFQEPQEQPC